MANPPTPRELVRQAIKSDPGFKITMWPDQFFYGNVNIPFVRPIPFEVNVSSKNRLYAKFTILNFKGTQSKELSICFSQFSMIAVKCVEKAGQTTDTDPVAIIFNLTSAAAKRVANAIGENVDRILQERTPDEKTCKYLRETLVMFLKDNPTKEETEVLMQCTVNGQDGQRVFEFDSKETFEIWQKELAWKWKTTMGDKWLSQFSNRTYELVSKMSGMEFSKFAFALGLTPRIIDGERKYFWFNKPVRRIQQAFLESTRAKTMVEYFAQKRKAENENGSEMESGIAAKRLRHGSLCTIHVLNPSAHQHHTDRKPYSIVCHDDRKVYVQRLEMSENDKAECRCRLYYEQQMRGFDEGCLDGWEIYEELNRVEILDPEEENFEVSAISPKIGELAETPQEISEEVTKQDSGDVPTSAEVPQNVESAPIPEDDPQNLKNEQISEEAPQNLENEQISEEAGQDSGTLPTSGEVSENFKDSTIPEDDPQSLETLPSSEKVTQNLEDAPISGESTEKLENAPNSEEVTENLENATVSVSLAENLENAPIPEQVPQSLENSTIPEDDPQNLESAPIPEDDPQNLKNEPISEKVTENLENAPIFEEAEQNSGALPTSGEVPQNLENPISEEVRQGSMSEEVATSSEEAPQNLEDSPSSEDAPQESEEAPQNLEDSPSSEDAPQESEEVTENPEAPQNFQKPISEEYPKYEEDRQHLENPEDSGAVPISFDAIFEEKPQFAMMTEEKPEFSMLIEEKPEFSAILEVKPMSEVQEVDKNSEEAQQSPKYYEAPAIFPRVEEVAQNSEKYFEAPAIFGEKSEIKSNSEETPIYYEAPAIFGENPKYFEAVSGAIQETAQSPKYFEAPAIFVKTSGNNPQSTVYYEAPPISQEQPNYLENWGNLENQKLFEENFLKMPLFTYNQGMVYGLGAECEKEKNKQEDVQTNCYHTEEEEQKPMILKRSSMNEENVAKVEMTEPQNTLQIEQYGECQPSSSTPSPSTLPPVPVPIAVPANPSPIGNFLFSPTENDDYGVYSEFFVSPPVQPQPPTNFVTPFSSSQQIPPHTSYSSYNNHYSFPITPQNDQGPVGIMQKLKMSSTGPVKVTVVKKIVKKVPIANEAVHLSDDEAPKTSEIAAKSEEVKPKEEEEEVVTDETQLMAAKHLKYDSVVIIVKDMHTLARQEFVNDNIVNFIIDWLMNCRIKKELRDKLYVYVTFFYSRLVTNVNTAQFSAKNGLSKEEMLKLEANINYLSRWTLKKFDIFDKDYLIVPINEEYHWLVAFIVNPAGAIVEVENEEESRKKPKCYIVFLDPLTGLDPRRQTNMSSCLKHYLQGLYNKSKTPKGKFATAMPTLFDMNRIEVFRPKNMPVQANYYDCGLYVLYYIEAFFCGIRPFGVEDMPGFDWLDHYEKGEDMCDLMRDKVYNIMTRLMTPQNRSRLEQHERKKRHGLSTEGARLNRRHSAAWPRAEPRNTAYHLRHYSLSPQRNNMQDNSLFNNPRALSKMWVTRRARELRLPEEKFASMY